MTDTSHTETYPFFVDGQPYQTEQKHLSGLQIKNIAHVDGSYQLYLEEQGNQPDRAISDGETVQMDHREKHFFAVPPATFGGRAA